METKNRKPSPDEVGERYAALLQSFFGCGVRYIRDADIYDDDFYQLEFETEKPYEDIELIEEKVSESVQDVINLAKFGPRIFQATIWLAPKQK